jgi:hypothetical protein
MMADEDESRDRKASRPSWRVALRIAAVTSLTTGVLAPFVYASMGTSLLSLGFGASDKGISAGDCWVFAPGAALLGGWLCYHLARQRLTWRLRLVHGAAIGAIGAGFNLPLAILFYKMGQDQLWRCSPVSELGSSSPPCGSSSARRCPCPAVPFSVSGSAHGARCRFAVSATTIRESIGSGTASF